MLNKNDPLIDSVRKVMEQNAKERAAAQSVNEKFGVTDRKALPHNRQNEWETAYKKVLSEGNDMELWSEKGDKKEKTEKSKRYRHKTSGKEVNSVKDMGKEWEVVNEGSDPYAENEGGSAVTQAPPKPTPKPKITKADPAKGQDPYAEGQASSISTVKEDLTGNQHKIDVNNNNKVDSGDLKMLRVKKAIQKRMGK